jgi:hypothetical protein
VDESLIAVDSTARPLAVRAQVRAADHFTRYVRAGSGQPVLVLDVTSGKGELLEAPSADRRELSIWPELLGRLAAHSRVIVPELPAAGPEFAAWLRSFIDGVGLAPLTLVAADPLCVAALEFVLSDPERVRRLVLIPDGHGDEAGLLGAVQSEHAGVDVAVLVVRRNDSTGAAIACVEQFIRSDARSAASAPDRAP